MGSPRVPHTDPRSVLQYDDGPPLLNGRQGGAPCHAGQASPHWTWASRSPWR